MITLAIRYTVDHNKLVDFETYVRALPAHIERCGGKCVGYYLPTKLAGPSNGVGPGRHRNPPPRRIRRLHRERGARLHQARAGLRGSHSGIAATIGAASAEAPARGRP